MFSDCSWMKELDISSFKTDNLQTIEKMFSYCISLKYIKFSPFFKTKNVISMSRMFYECYTLKELDLSSFTSENLKDCSDMFNSCYELEKLNLSKFIFNNIDNNNIGIFKSCIALSVIVFSNYYSDKISIIIDIISNNI